MEFSRILILIVIIYILLVSSTIIAQNNYIYYTVKKGDNLTKIAEIFNTIIDKIISLNNIKNPDLIKTGAKLRIPAAITYTVKRGDSLIEIADKFNVNMELLIKINNIKNADLIIAGDKLNIVTNEKRNRRLNVSRGSSLSLIWPVHGRISSEYGWRIHPIKHSREFHNGIDIAVPIGSPVYAAEDGIIIFSDYSEGYGNLIIIEHRGSKKTYYAHNLELIVGKGERISKGKVIALSGNSGLSTGPHLHFEIRQGNRSEDPMKYLNQKYLRNGFKV